MADDKFDRLLTALPEIAKAVNAFDSADVQEKAFDALIWALGLAKSAASPPRSGQPGEADPPARARSDSSSAASQPDDSGDKDRGAEKQDQDQRGKGRRRRSTAKPVLAERDINFRPPEAQSFRDFVAEKNPATIPQRNVVAVYYLEHVLGLSSIGAGHVLAAYRDCNWREPNNTANALQVTASTKGWIDTKDMTSIRTTASGRNEVQHDMPKPPKK